jgi:hypothetical protein
MKLKDCYKILVPSYFYHKYFNIILNYNSQYIDFNNLFVVTSNLDLDTCSICNKHNINVIKIDYNQDDLFDKCIFINAGIEYIKEKYPDSIIIVMNSDVILNDNYVNVINNTNIELGKIYGGYYHSLTIDQYINNKINTIDETNCNKLNLITSNSTQIFCSNCPKYINNFKSVFNDKVILPIFTYNIRTKSEKMKDICQQLKHERKLYDNNNN